MTAALEVVPNDGGGNEETSQGRKRSAKPQPTTDQEIDLLRTIDENLTGLDPKDRGIAVMLLERTPEQRHKLITAVGAIGEKSDKFDGALARALTFVRARITILRPTFPAASNGRTRSR